MAMMLTHHGDKAQARPFCSTFEDMSWPIWHAGLAVAGGFLGRTVVQHVQLPLGFVTWMWVDSWCGRNVIGEILTATPNKNQAYTKVIHITILNSRYDTLHPRWNL